MKPKHIYDKSGKLQKLIPILIESERNGERSMKQQDRRLRRYENARARVSLKYLFPKPKLTLEDVLPKIECLICDSKKNLQYHEIHGKKHRYGGYAKGYVFKNPNDFIVLCCKCHRGLHSLMRGNIQIAIELLENLTSERSI